MNHATVIALGAAAIGLVVFAFCVHLALSARKNRVKADGRATGAVSSGDQAGAVAAAAGRPASAGLQPRGTSDAPGAASR